TMGDKGMADMGAMQMPLPENTLPMMTGEGPFGALEMGGMFTTVKVRTGIARGDVRDPGWYQHPPGSVAREWTGPLEEPVRRQGQGGATDVHVAARKPSGNGHH
ncbi:MAG: copper oxidase, partial [Betaproteobacteria bacterium]